MASKLRSLVQQVRNRAVRAVDPHQLPTVAHPGTMRAAMMRADAERVRAFVDGVTAMRAWAGERAATYRVMADASGGVVPLRLAAMELAELERVLRVHGTQLETVADAALLAGAIRVPAPDPTQNNVAGLEQPPAMAF